MTGPTERSWKPWTDGDDDRLVAMVLAGGELIEMAAALDRTANATGMRRVKLRREGRCQTS